MSAEEDIYNKMKKDKDKKKPYDDLYKPNKPENKDDKPENKEDTYENKDSKEEKNGGEWNDINQLMRKYSKSSGGSSDKGKTIANSKGIYFDDDVKRNLERIAADADTKRGWMSAFVNDATKLALKQAGLWKD